MGEQGRAADGGDDGATPAAGAPAEGAPDRTAGGPDGAASDATGGDRAERDYRLSQEGYVLLLAGLAALATALLGAAMGEPAGVVLLANLTGIVGLFAAANEHLRDREPTVWSHAAVGAPALLGGLLALRSGVWLTAAILVMVAALALWRVGRAWRA